MTRSRPDAVPHAPPVVRAGFAPVKGTRHQPYDAVVLDWSGPVGDRGWCLVDTEQRRVLRTVQHPALVAVSAAVTEAGLELTLPTGESVCAPPEPAGDRLTCDYWGRAVELELVDGPHGALASTYLGKPVRLAAAPPGGVVYAGAVTLVSTGTLRALGDHLGTSDLGALAARFRPTFVVDAEPHAEDGWLGHEVDLGPARVRVGQRVPRCAVVDVDPVTGERGSSRAGGVLAALAAYRPRDEATGDLLLGVDAEVVVPGAVSPG